MTTRIDANSRPRRDQFQDSQSRPLRDAKLQCLRALAAKRVYTPNDRAGAYMLPIRYYILHIRYWYALGSV